ncbi:Dihydrolipoyllysine-residue acetyltransferase component of pyruvate dehydrogenase complex [Bremerella volcania]|uniref:Dihydrolipoamide acetyltransferase component of pyruvate dehydrogenase complex n=1 Tax=Bremerella volcania TaxID=2527984 RepID=A0A518C9U2_9BACT|nr:2-oxo acid dehydrogenase subunit E2 [Bremerella volcania]QDU75996.1 Dihydrolipoyllysine-residue acetyltransferase component of pyruvate dehydrogenase complex [Bremerella volcania]
MSIDVQLPDLGDGIESGDVLAVHVSVGDTVEKGQTLIEIETDKATVDVPSTEGGKIAKVHVKTGDTVAVHAPIVTLEGAGSGGGSAPAAEPPKEEKAPEPEAKEEAPEPAPPKEDPTPAPAPPKPAPAPATPPRMTTPPPVPVAEAPSADDSVPAGPAVRRFAREVGVDLRNVQGSGPNGRIERDDVLRTVRDLNQGGPSTKSGTASAPAATGSLPSLTGEANEDKYGPVRIEKMKKIRKVTAAQMSKSWTTAPRVTNFDDADITALEELRQQSKDDYAEAGVKLTTMPFLIKAVAVALREHPELNATIDMEQEQIIYKDYVNVGIAVDSDRGLLVPNMKNTDRMSIPDIARGLQQTASDIRGNTFEMSALQGGTFTISNLGAIGGTYSTPIINVPEVAILLVGRSRKMPVVVKDQIVARLMMPLSLSYDHRLVDGATAQRFLNDVKSLLENPSKLLMAP